MSSFRPLEVRRGAGGKDGNCDELGREDGEAVCDDDEEGVFGCSFLNKRRSIAHK